MSVWDCSHPENLSLLIYITLFLRTLYPFPRRRQPLLLHLIYIYALLLESLRYLVSVPLSLSLPYIPRKLWQPRFRLDRIR